MLQRNLARMAAQPFDVVIIGGGITGACIAWDASLRGFSVGLIEKRDFASATTAASSKLIHGGLRYLRNLEFGLVRESLRERRIWQNIAPHMVMPLQFVLPCATWFQRLTLRAGLLLYDVLSFDRNCTAAVDKFLPGHGALSMKDALAQEPVLAGAAPAGALSYYDCQMHCPERLALEFIGGAAANGAQIANYAQVLYLNETAGSVDGVHVCDQITGDEFDVYAKLVINAAGPWADDVASEPGKAAAVALLRSKGIHLITRAISRKAIAVLSEGAHFFVLPWRGHSLLATTDTPYTDDPNNLKVEESDITALLAKINAGLPEAKLSRSDIVHCYAGLRPLIADPAAPQSGTYGASRGSEIFDHEKEQNRPGLISALGGKWTTSRHLAEQVVDLAAQKLRAIPFKIEPDGSTLKGKIALYFNVLEQLYSLNWIAGRFQLSECCSRRTGRKCATALTPLPGGAMENFPAFVEEAKMRHAAINAGLIDHLASMYGAGVDAIISLIAADPDMGEPLSPHLPEVGAQIRHAARCELALTLEDAVFRRTGLCTLGHPGNAALNRAAEIMAQELSWDAVETAHQIAVVEARLIAAQSEQTTGQPVIPRQISEP